jgi:hypothetical protein
MSTLGDLVRRADAAPIDERRALLDEAELVARDSHEWCLIAISRASLPDRDGALRCLTTARELGGTDVAAFRFAARIHHQLLDDVAGAQVTLAAGSAALLGDRSTSSSAWRRLAEGWRELGDLDTARHYLEHGRAFARDAEELCDIAEAYVRIADRETAQALVHEAETRGGWWAVANVVLRWFDDPDRARASLERGLREAGSVDDVVSITKAFVYIDAEPEDLDRCLAMAEPHASSVGDWIDLAWAHHVIVFDADEAHRCLVRAAQIATTDTDRHRIAYARHTWSLDAIDGIPTTDDLPPFELRPAAFVRRAGRSSGWDRDPERLFDWLRGQLDRSRLERVAALDDGYRVEDNLAELDRIRSSGLVPHPLTWRAQQVCELERWTSRSVDHVARAFACTVLCLDEAGPCSRTEGNESTLGVLLESCIELGAEAVSGLTSLLAAMADAYPHTVRTSMPLFTELTLALAAAWLDPSDPRIESLVARLIEDERRDRELATGWRPDRPSDGWLLDLTHFAQGNELLRALATRILDRPIAAVPNLIDLLRG